MRFFFVETITQAVRVSSAFVDGFKMGLMTPWAAALHERQSWTVTVPCFPFAGTTSSAPVTRLLMCRYVSDQVSLERPLLCRTNVPLKWPEAFVTFTDWSFAACFAVSRAVIFTAVACLAPATPASAASPITHEMSVSKVRFILNRTWSGLFAQ